MDKPVILAVDDDPGVLAAVVRDIRRQYGSGYDVLRAASGAEALEVLRELKLKGRAVALLVVDQRMPQMTGVEFMRESLPLYPEAKRALLTAYADTDAAIKAINEVHLDHYLLKPWDPPEERLYPVLDDLLDDWRANFQPVIEGVRIVGHRWSADGHRIRDFLVRNLIPYRWLDIETDAEAGQLRALAGAGAEAPLPVAVLPDGTVLSNPSLVDLGARLGLSSAPQLETYDLIVVGSGPAGLAAAVYGASEGLRVVIVEGEAPGGQAGTSSRIENYLGFPVGLSGSDLARRGVAQAKRFGAEILSPVEAVKLQSENGYHLLTLSNGAVLASQAMILTMGVSYNKLAIPGADRLAGAGLYYGAALSEALSVKDQDVYIIGAGNSAGQAAVYLANYARSVTLLVRGGSLVGAMSRYLIERAGQTPNIHVRLNAAVEQLHGDDMLRSITVVDKQTGATEMLDTPAVFCFIGAAPRTGWVRDVVQLDELGFIRSGTELVAEGSGRRPAGWMLPRDPFPLETSVSGIFVAGDVRHHSIKRMATAIGEGSMCISYVHLHLRSPEIAGRPPTPMGQ